MDWTRGHTIGHGASAAVSIAISHHSGDVFAVKSAELSKSESLQRENKILSTLNSPHIVGYRGCGISLENNEVMFNLMIEYAAYGSLSDAARRSGGGLTEPAIRHYTRGIVKGLEFLHSRGIVHCDIKGSNILISKSEAKIADFGCAKAVEEAVIGGTPLFMAPEVARGEEQGFPADIWALGCTVVEMATGHAPWPNVAATLHRIAFSGETPRIPACLSELAKDFLSKCLRVDSRERMTAKELLRHPFLDDFRHEKMIIESADSPTSILDQGIWSSTDEEISYDQSQMNFADVLKLEELCRNSRMEEWDCTETEGWITVRDSKHIDLSNDRFLRCRKTEHFSL